MIFYRTFSPYSYSFLWCVKTLYKSLLWSLGSGFAVLIVVHANWAQRWKSVVLENLNQFSSIIRIRLQLWSYAQYKFVNTSWKWLSWKVIWDPCWLYLVLNCLLLNLLGILACERWPACFIDKVKTKLGELHTAPKLRIQALCKNIKNILVSRGILICEILQKILETSRLWLRSMNGKSKQTSSPFFCTFSEPSSLASKENSSIPQWIHWLLLIATKFYSNLRFLFCKIWRRWEKVKGQSFFYILLFFPNLGS